MWLLLVVVFAVLGALSFLYLRKTPAPRVQNAVDLSLLEFWRPFLADPQGPLTVVSNAPFAGNAIDGLYYQRLTKDSPNVHSYYTGIGEAMSVHQLDTLFSQLGSPLRMRPGSLLSVDDLRDTSLIFVGAPVENLMVNKIVTLKNFSFRQLTSGPRKGQVVIDNTTPKSGEPKVYMSNSLPDAKLTDDYALISSVPIDANHQALVAAGTTTIGTEAAIEFLCDPASLKRVREWLPANTNNKEAYELILHIQVVDDVPMHAEIVASREYQQAQEDEMPIRELVPIRGCSGR